MGLKQLVEGPEACALVEFLDLDWSTTEDNPTEDNLTEDNPNADNLAGLACSKDVVGLRLVDHHDRRDHPDDLVMNNGYG